MNSPRGPLRNVTLHALITKRHNCLASNVSAGLCDTLGMRTPSSIPHLLFDYSYTVLQTLPACLPRCTLCVMCETVFVERLWWGLGCQVTPWKCRAAEFALPGPLGKDGLSPWASVLSSK